VPGWVPRDVVVLLAAAVAGEAKAGGTTSAHTIVTALAASSVHFSHGTHGLIQKPFHPNNENPSTSPKWMRTARQVLSRNQARRYRHWKSSLNWDASASDRWAIVRLRKCTRDKDRAVLPPRTSGSDQENYILPAF
jgi:hypothetical protein